MMAARSKATIGPTLTAVEQRYGVPTGIILGIWGLESNYGDAASTTTPPPRWRRLAFEGRRRAQFETYLMALTEMVERGLADATAIALVLGRRARPAAIHAGRLSHHRRRLGRRWPPRHLDQSRRCRRLDRQLSARSRLASRRAGVRRSDACRSASTTRSPTAPRAAIADWVTARRASHRWRAMERRRPHLCSRNSSCRRAPMGRR